ncbi:hypothetical protein HMPREF1989_01777 [Porphyromonas gingivalis F0566]|nr:hypothetical protein HMPREF1989_01777 [Porphyromonas gingivalis F0566]
MISGCFGPLSSQFTAIPPTFFFYDKREGHRNVCLVDTENGIGAVPMRLNTAPKIFGI